MFSFNVIWLSEFCSAKLPFQEVLRVFTTGINYEHKFVEWKILVLGKYLWSSQFFIIQTCRR